MRVQTTTPYDLIATGALASLTTLVVLADPWGPLRVALGLPFVLFLPGYALVAALFPERHRTYSVDKGEDREETEEVEEGIDTLERVALSLGLSIAVVPLIGLGLNYTPWGIRLIPILVSLTVFVLAASGVAYARRQRLPDDERFRIAFEIEPPAWSEYSTLDKVLTVALAVSIVFAAGALVYVLTTPRVGERFTEFYILGPDGKATGYPTNLTAGEQGRLIVGITNQEHAPVRYDARMIAQEGTFVNASGNRTFQVDANRTLATWAPSLEHNETWEENVTVSLQDPGQYRLLFHLDMPNATEQPYRRLHLWINVTAGDA